MSFCASYLNKEGRLADIVDNFGEVLRTVRKERGLSQEALAYRVGVEQTEISKLETGKLQPSSERLRKLAEALEVPEHAFLK